MLYYEPAFELLIYSENIKEATDKIIDHLKNNEFDNINLCENVQIVRITDDSFEVSYFNLEIKRNLDDVLTVHEAKHFDGVIDSYDFYDTITRNK